MSNFPQGKFNIIYADPPWKYGDSRNYKVKNNPSGAGGASKHYAVMSLEGIKSLPVADLIDRESCFLFLWCTGPKMDWGIEVLKSWGFKFVTIVFDWVKVKNDYSGIRHDGIGCYTNNNTEYVLLGRVGKYQRANTGVRKIIEAPKMGHSQKPPEVADRIVKLIGDLPRIELFARDRKEGWEAWGNEI